MSSWPGAARHPHLVVGIDGSPGAERAARWAGGAADRIGADLVAVHAHRPGALAVVAVAPPLVYADGVAERWEEDLSEVFSGVWCRPLRNHGTSISTRFEQGQPTRLLVSAAHLHNALAIIVGSRCRGGLAEHLLGSVGHHLTHHSDVPVVVVRGEPRPAAVARILVGVDQSADARAALDWAAEVAALSGSEIYLAGVIDREARHPAASDEGCAGVVDILECHLARAARPLRSRGLAVRLLTREGPVVASLLALAEEIDAGLIVTGRRGLGEVREAIHGSVSHQLMHRSTRPVAVVPLRSAPQPDGSGPRVLTCSR
ncbi:MAG: universal stress protein [Candidatus Dormibacteria bacterium]|jgi:nucleotide-binding universal stress UspA family protein